MLSDLVALVRDIAQAVGEWRQERRALSLLAPILGHPRADPVLTIEQAATYSGLDSKTLKIDALASKLATLQRSESGRVRVRLSDLNAYLNDQVRVATAAGKTTHIKAKDIDWGA